MLKNGSRQDEELSQGTAESVEVPWIQISHRLGINSTKVNGFYKYKGTTNSKRACYLKNLKDDCWIYFQHSKTQGDVWFIGDPRKGNYAYVVEDLQIPVNPTNPLYIWNGKVFEEDASVLMQVYDPSHDVDIEAIKHQILSKLNKLEKVTDYPEGEVIFGTLKEHIEQSRPHMEVHYSALMDGVIERMIRMLKTDVDAVKKTVYKFLGLFIYYFKELKDVTKKKQITKWCEMIFSQCLPYINADFEAVEGDVTQKPQVLVNATLVLRNSMEFIMDVSAENAELLIPIVGACVKGMRSNSPDLSLTDREIFSGPVYMAAMFDRAIKFKRSSLIYIASQLMDEPQISNSFKLKLSRLITSLSEAEQYPEVREVQIEPFVTALKMSKEGKPVGLGVGDLRWVLWHACYLVKCLAFNDHYKVDLIKLDVVQVCIEIISKEFSGEDLYLIPNRENRIQCFGILEHLSFCPQFRAVATEPLQMLLKKFKDHERLGRYVERILWNLKFDPRNIAKSERNSSGPILLCFAAADDEARRHVLHLVKEKSSFNGVINEFQDFTSMTEAVDKASVILLGLSPNLAKSAKTRIEVEYAQATGKFIVALNIAYPDYRNRMTGWLSRFSRSARDMTNPNEFPRTMEMLLNLLTKDIQAVSDYMLSQQDRQTTGSDNSVAGYSTNPVPVQRVSPEVYPKPVDGSSTSIEDIYRWLKETVQLDPYYIDRFRSSQMTAQGFIHLRYLAINLFSDFRDLLSQPEFQFPIGIALHLGYFLKWEFFIQQPDYKQQHDYQQQPEYPQRPDYQEMPDNLKRKSRRRKPWGKTSEQMSEEERKGRSPYESFPYERIRSRSRSKSPDPDLRELARDLPMLSGAI